jgi:CMP-N-acetylneuraminic acid synthetase
MKIDIVIPALKKNRYSPKGDLASWGNTTLLEWKISQAKKINDIQNIYVATPDNDLIYFCKELNIKTIFRKKKLSSMFYEISQKLYKRNILWLYCTSPFLSERTINKFVQKYKKNYKKYDSALTCTSEYEYFFYNNKSFNFNSKKSPIERSKVSPLIKITNGAYITNSEVTKGSKNFMGKKPLFFKINWLSSLEIKQSKDINIYNSFFQSYDNEY